MTFTKAKTSKYVILCFIEERKDPCSDHKMVHLQKDSHEETTYLVNIYKGAN